MNTACLITGICCLLLFYVCLLYVGYKNRPIPEFTEEEILAEQKYLNEWFKAHPKKKRKTKK